MAKNAVLITRRGFRKLRGRIGFGQGCVSVNRIKSVKLAENDQKIESLFSTLLQSLGLK